jgi:SAM-dependent methyltransferase
MLPPYQFIASMLEFQHRVLRGFLRPGFAVLDATCGNGNDTVFLWKCVQPDGFVLACDLQAAAVEETRRRIEALAAASPEPALLGRRVAVYQRDHADLGWASDALGTLTGGDSPPVKAIVYNLGFLPHGDKRVLTQASTTIASMASGLKLLQKDGGLLAALAYTGHDGGQERDDLRAWIKTLPSSEFSALDIQLANRDAPTLFLIEARPLLPGEQARNRTERAP